MLVSFLFSTAHFCWVENDENFDSSKKVRFVQVFFTNVVVSAELECQQKMLGNSGNNAYCRIRPPETFLYLPKPTAHQISRQTEHLAMCTSRARKCRRNESTYCRLAHARCVFRQPFAHLYRNHEAVKLGRTSRYVISSQHWIFQWVSHRFPYNWFRASHGPVISKTMGNPLENQVLDRNHISRSSSQLYRLVISI